MWRRAAAFLTFAAFTCGAAAAGAATSPDITVTRTDAGYLMVLKLDHVPEGEEGRKLVVPRAEALCKPQPVRWGTFRYNTVANPKGQGVIYTLNQEFACGGPADGPPGSEIADSWKPTAAEGQAVGDRTYSFFEVIRTHDTAGAMPMFEPQSGVKAEVLSDYLQSFRDRIGVLKDAKIVSMASAANPPSEPLKGGYVQVLFQAEYQRAPLVCGQIVWYRHGAGDFRILRFDQNTPSKEQMAKKEPCA